MRVRRGGRMSLRIVLAVSVLAALVLWHSPIIRIVGLPIASLATGYGISADGLEVDLHRLDLAGLHISRDGLPILDVARVRASYDALAVMRGTAGRGSHLALDLEQPHLSLMRHPDGTFGFTRSPGAPAPAASAAPEAGPAVPAAPAATPGPLDVDIRLSGGVVDLRDASRVLPEAQRYVLDGIDGRVRTRGLRTTGRFVAMLRDADQPPARAGVSFDEDARSEASVVRVRVPVIALRAPLAYVINTTAVRVGAGQLRDVDLRWYAFAGSAYRMTGSARLAHAELTIPGVAVPLREFSAEVGIAGDTVTFGRGRTDLGDLRAIRVAGGLYNFSSPQFDLGLAVDHASLPAIGGLFAFSRRLPLAGDGRADIRLAGPVASPLVAVGLDLPRLAYGRYPMSDALGAVVYNEGALSIENVRTRYGQVAVRVDGSIGLGAHTVWQLLAHTDGPASGLPYLASALPSAQSDGEALMTGTDRALDARGVLAASGPSGSAAGFFHVDPEGVGSFGPIALQRADGSDLAGAFLLDRSDGDSGFWLDTRDVAFADSTEASLPGLEGFHAPSFSGRFAGAVAGVTTPAGFRLRGRLHGRDVTAGPVDLAEVDAEVGGAFDRLGLSRARARGPFGTFDGSGSYADGTLALAGTYDGSFEQIRKFTGDLGARGRILGPVAIEIGPQSTFVQARDDRTPGARVRGVPLDGIAGSLIASAAGVRVIAASAAVAGGSLTGSGRLAAAGSAPVPADQRLAVTLAGADAARLRSSGLGLAAGRLSGFGRLAASRSGTAFDGGFAVANALVPSPRGALPADGSGFVSLDGSRAAFADASGELVDTAGIVDGAVFGLGSEAGMRYDLDVRLPSAEAGPLLTRFLPAADGDEATVSGRLHIGGTGRRPVLRGDLQIPEGLFHGLAFDSASAGVLASADALFLRRGSVRVGSTRLAFSGGERSDDGGLRVSSSDVHLADFDDYFDEGDTLAGDGPLLLRFRRRHGQIETQADTDLTDVRVRSFSLGDASAHWSARGPRVSGRLAFGGASGTLDVAGSVEIGPHVRLERILSTSRYDGTARLENLDLGTWLPAIGVQVPVTGRLDAQATVRGVYPGFDLAATATLRDGTLAHLPVTRFSLTADSTLARTRISDAELALPGLSLRGSGIVGLGPRGTVDLRVHGSSEDIGSLALRLGTGLGVTGAAEADVHVDGPRVRPRVTGGFDLEHGMAGPIAVKRAIGEFQVQGRDLVLSDAEVAFTRSTLYLAGSVPLTVAPFGFGPAAAPITLELQTRDLELSDFAPLLPPQSILTGRIDGRVRVAGTAGAPALFGRLTLANGTLAAPLETAPIRDLAATLSFSGRQMDLEKLQGDLGGGSLRASGDVTFADLVHPGADAEYAFAASGKHLFLDLPAFGRGTIDGDLHLTHTPGSLPLLAGTASLDDAVIPFAALYVLPAPSEGGSLGISPAESVTVATDALAAAVAPAAPQDLALSLDVTADRNVRVRSGNVDIGGKGTLQVRGTKSAPVLDGSFDSTGGTLTYFNTLFRIQRGTVTFAPDTGLIPSLDARATSHVVAPDPRNLAGSADITIDVEGPVTALGIQLSSDPPYSRDQILGLLFSVPAIGGSTLLTQQSAIANTPGSALGVEGPANVAQSRSGNANGDISVGQEAFGILNAQFTRNLLAPLETAFSGAVGLSDLNVNVDYSGQVGFTARKFLGHKIDAVFGESFGYPEQRQSFGFEFRPNQTLAAQITAFQSIGEQVLGVQTPSALLHTVANPRLTGTQPIGGTAGFSLSLQHLF